MLEGLHRPADRLRPVWKSRLEKPRLRVSAFCLALTEEMLSRPLISSFERQSLRGLSHQALARCPAQESRTWAADAHSMRQAAGQDVPLNAFGRAILGGSVWTRIHPDRCQPVCCPEVAKKHPGFAPSLSAFVRRGAEEQGRFCWLDGFPQNVPARSVGSHPKLLTLPPRIHDPSETDTPEKREAGHATSVYRFIRPEGASALKTSVVVGCQSFVHLAAEPKSGSTLNFDPSAGKNRQPTCRQRCASTDGKRPKARAQGNSTPTIPFARNLRSRCCSRFITACPRSSKT